MANDYLNQINIKETNQNLVSLRSFAEENNVPIITIDGISFLNQIIRLKQIKSVLEIGTAIGYSSINMALKNDIKVTTIERNEEMYNLAVKNIEKNNLTNNIKVIYQDALEVDESLLGRFDLVFIDADKRQYIEYYNAIMPLLKQGGFILADDVLWDGKVIEDIDPNDKQTQGILDFNKHVQDDNRVENLMLPIRHGLMMIRKK